MSTTVTIKSLEERADRLFSEYVRRRDRNHADQAQCCTCGGWFHWKELDCGHYMSRKYLSTRYSEYNTGPQCRTCNRMKGGEQLKFLFYLEGKYGKEVVTKVEEATHFTVKDKREFLLQVIETVKIKLKEIRF